MSGESKQDTETVTGARRGFVDGRKPLGSMAAPGRSRSRVEPDRTVALKLRPRRDRQLPEFTAGVVLRDDAVAPENVVGQDQRSCGDVVDEDKRFVLEPVEREALGRKRGSVADPVQSVMYRSRPSYGPWLGR